MYTKCTIKNAQSNGRRQLSSCIHCFFCSTPLQPSYDALLAIIFKCFLMLFYTKYTSTQPWYDALCAIILEYCWTYFYMKYTSTQPSYDALHAIISKRIIHIVISLQPLSLHPLQPSHDALQPQYNLVIFCI